MTGAEARFSSSPRDGGVGDFAAARGGGETRAGAETATGARARWALRGSSLRMRTNSSSVRMNASFISEFIVAKFRHVLHSIKFEHENVEHGWKSGS